MPDKYSITLTLDSATLQDLHNNEMVLCGYKGLEASAKPIGHPIWFATNELSSEMVVTWDAQYGGYVKDSRKQDNLVIDSSSQQAMNLGDLMVLENDGATNVTTVGGEPGCIVITSEEGDPWICGMSQLKTLNGNQSLSPICAFELAGQNAVIMKPKEIVMLEFRSSAAQTGSVIHATTSQCMVFDLTDPTSITGVSYAVNRGWDANGSPHAKSVKALTDLTQFLITLI